MVSKNGTSHGTAFTVSIEAAEGVTTGISAADRAHTVKTAVNPKAQPSDLVQPGHIFPLQAVDGGVLMRAGHTEAGCDLAQLAGCTPAAVICEIMKDDGTMARLPDLIEFAKEHQLKIGTISDLIAYRSTTESLIKEISRRPIQTPHGDFILATFQDLPSDGVHLALIKGEWDKSEPVLARVHEPLSVLDLLETNRSMHSWSLDSAMKRIQKEGKGVIVLLNAGESGSQLLSQLDGTARSAQAPERGRMDLRTYGIGAQILRECGVGHMRLLGAPRKMPSMMGYGLEIDSYVSKDN